MSRILKIALVVAAVALGAWLAVRALASDETVVRWRLEGLVESFNDRSVLSFASGFSPDYRDDTAGVDRSMLQRMLLVVGRQRPGYRAELDPGRLVVTVGEPPDTARAEGAVRLLDGGQLLWEVALRAELQRVRGDWLVTRTEHETLQGRRPGG